MKPLAILVAGHDWGGLNVLAPLLRAWGDDPRFAVDFIGTPVVRRDLSSLVPGLRFAPASERLTDWVAHREPELDALLRDLLNHRRYDVVVCSTSAHSILERHLFAAARAALVPSIAFCDMWWAYAERFYDGTRWMLPDRLWVIDDAMRAAASEIEWPHPLPVDIVGSPLFADLMRRRSERGDRAGRAVRFVSEPVSIKFPEARIDEFALAEVLVNAVHDAGLDMPVVIRPHPVDSAEAWRRWCFARRHLNVEYDTLPLSEAIADSRFAVGISSILLTEMRMCGVPAAALQPRDADKSYYCLPFDELGIALLPEQSDLIAWFKASHGSVPPASAKHSSAIETATELLLAMTKHSTQVTA